MSKTITGIILAGGLSRRFGTPKAFAKRNGIPFYQYSIEALSPFTENTVIVTSKELLPLFDCLDRSTYVVSDAMEVKGEGPLAGLYTAMELIVSTWYMVLPVDVPFVQKWVFKELMEEMDPSVDAVIPIISHKKQPLFGLYHYSVKQQLLKQLKQGERSMHKFLENLHVNYVTLDDNEPFININRKSDYDTYINNKYR